MADPFIGEIRIFAGNFAPRDFALCNGQTIPISQNSALFAIIGNQYGGDGRTEFAVPNLQDRVPMHAGQGPGLSNRRIGQSGGSNSETLTPAQVPDHGHALRSLGPPTQADPNASVGLGETNLYATPGAVVDLAPGLVEPAGAAGTPQPHENRQPFLVLNFVIALAGLFPSR